MLSEKWEAEYEKLEKLCEANDIEFHVQKDNYPIRFTMKPRTVVTRQMSLIEQEKPNEIAMEFVFGEKLINNFIGDFHLDDETLSKIKTKPKSYITFGFKYGSKEKTFGGINTDTPIVSDVPMKL